MFLVSVSASVVIVCVVVIVATPPLPVAVHIVSLGLRFQTVDAVGIFVLVVPFLVPCMVDSEQPAQNIGTRQIVHGQIATALVFVFQKGKTFTLARLFVPDQIEVRRVTEL